MLCVIAGKILNPSFTTSFYDNTTHHIASEANGWNLILVNRDNYIPDDYKVQLAELSNGKKVDSRIYPELQEMFDAAREQGYGLFVREGYIITSITLLLISQQCSFLQYVDKRLPELIHRSLQSQQSGKSSVHKDSEKRHNPQFFVPP